MRTLHETTVQQQNDLAEPLNPKKHKNRKAFDCGITPLNRFLSETANQSSKRHTSRTYVVVDPDDHTLVAGYYTLTTTSVRSADMGSMMLKRYPGLDSSGLIARLAVDVNYHGQGLGEYLLVSAIKRLIFLSDGLGFPVIIVDPKDGAAAFYEKFGFQHFDDEEERMFLTIKDAIAAFDNI